MAAVMEGVGGIFFEDRIRRMIIIRRGGTVLLPVRFISLVGYSIFCTGWMRALIEFVKVVLYLSWYVWLLCIFRGVFALFLYYRQENTEGGYSSNYLLFTAEVTTDTLL